VLKYKPGVKICKWKNPPVGPKSRLDVLLSSLSSRVESVSDPNVVVVPAPTTSNGLIAWNVTVPPFSVPNGVTRPVFGTVNAIDKGDSFANPLADAVMVTVLFVI